MKNRDLAQTPGRNRGFSLAEMLITIAILAILTGPLVVVFFQSEASYQAQNQQAEVAQQMRIAMDQIVRCIRQSGNEPVAPIGVPPVVPLGEGRIVVNSDITGSIASVTGNPAESRGDPDGVAASIFEKVTFRHSVSDSRIYADVGYGEAVLADNISDLNFNFFDLNGNPTMNTNEIVRVQIEMVGETEDPDLQRGQLYSVTLQSEVFVRNRTPQIFPF